MVERRNLMGGGLVAGIAALVGAEAEAAVPQRDGDSAEISREVSRLRQVIADNFDGPWTTIARVRAQQRIWLRANHKYPDFIEVGMDVWDALYDWHVRFQQPINMTRAADGRYLMSFMFTTFILRPDQDASYLGPGFDGERRT